MRRRLDPEDRRREILRAARDLFATRPYDEVHVDDVATAAGASRALVNHYFRDKRGLLTAVVRAVVEDTPAVVNTDLGDLGRERMVDANTAAWLDLVEARRETVLMFMGAGPIGYDPDLEEARDLLRDRLAERMLVNHLGTADIPPVALGVMRAELGLIERAVRDWITGRGGDRESTHALIATSILATVRQVLPAVMEAAGEEPPEID